MKKYILLIILLLIAALNFNIFLKELNLVTGGTQGLSLILNKLYDINHSSIIFIINCISLTLSFIFLNKSITKSSIISSLIYPLFIKLTSFIKSLHIIKNIPFISSLITGIISGITTGLIYKLSFSQGGINTLNLIISKYAKIKISIINFIINTTIILIGLNIFGIKKTIYSIIVITINSMVINFILNKNNLTINKN